MEIDKAEQKRLRQEAKELIGPLDKQPACGWITRLKQYINLDQCTCSKVLDQGLICYRCEYLVALEVLEEFIKSK